MGTTSIEWAAKQAWSNGKVAMQGGSYLGQNQWRAAQAAPPSLVTIFPMVASTSIYHDWITLNGGWRLSFNFGWGPVRHGVAHHAEPRSSHHRPAARHPLRPGAVAPAAQHDAATRGAPGADSTTSGSRIPDYDDYWKPLSVEERFDKIAIPVHTFGGWFDIFSQGTLRGYVGMSQKGATEKARRSHLVMGPWGHGPSQKYGRARFRS